MKIDRSDLTCNPKDDTDDYTPHLHHSYEAKYSEPTSIGRKNVNKSKGIGSRPIYSWSVVRLLWYGVSLLLSCSWGADSHKEHEPK